MARCSSSRSILVIMPSCTSFIKPQLSPAEPLQAVSNKERNGTVKKRKKRKKPTVLRANEAVHTTQIDSLSDRSCSPSTAAYAATSSTNTDTRVSRSLYPTLKPRQPLSLRRLLDRLVRERPLSPSTLASSGGSSFFFGATKTLFRSSLAPGSSLAPDASSPVVYGSLYYLLPTPPARALPAYIDDDHTPTSLALITTRFIPPARATFDVNPNRPSSTLSIHDLCVPWIQRHDHLDTIYSGGTPSETSSRASSDADGVSDGDPRLHREMRLLERAQRRGESPKGMQSAASGDSLGYVDEEDLEEAEDVPQTDSEQSRQAPKPSSTESRDTQINDSDMIAAFTEEFGEVGPHTDSNESTGDETETWVSRCHFQFKIITSPRDSPKLKGLCLFLTDWCYLQRSPPPRSFARQLDPDEPPHWFRRSLRRQYSSWRKQCRRY